MGHLCCDYDLFHNSVACFAYGSRENPVNLLSSDIPVVLRFCFSDKVLNKPGARLNVESFSCRQTIILPHEMKSVNSRPS